MTNKQNYLQDLYPGSLIAYWKFEYDPKDKFLLKNSAINSIG